MTTHLDYPLFPQWFQLVYLQEKQHYVRLSRLYLLMKIRNVEAYPSLWHIQKNLIPTSKNRNNHFS